MKVYSISERNLPIFLLQMRMEKIGIDDSLIGGNKSAEGGGDEGADDSDVSGIDVVMNHKLVESPMTKAEYKKYIKKYMAK